MHYICIQHNDLNYLIHDSIDYELIWEAVLFIAWWYSVVTFLLVYITGVRC